MKYPIWKERLHLMSPAAHVCAAATWNTPPRLDALRDALLNAVRCHAILGCRAAIEPNGEACLTARETERAVDLIPFSGDVEPLILEQERIPFAIDDGETIRFFYRGDAARPTLVVIAHHLVCDGGSILIFLRDVLRAVNGQPLEEHPVRLLTRGDLPAHPGLSPFLRVMMRRANAKWARSGRAFSFDEFRAMFSTYAASRPAGLKLYTIGAAQTARIVLLAREKGVTVNHLLVAAFADGLPRGESVGIAVDVRPKGALCMGNFAVGAGVRVSCNPSKSLPENAAAARQAINKCLNNPAKKFFLHEFMTAISPTLTDSIYFCAYGDYRHPVSESLRAMCGYTDRVKGITVTNLKTADMPDDPAWSYRFDALAFVPPYIPNVRAVIGVSTHGGRMTLSLRAPAGARFDAEEARFDRACKCLELL